MTHISAQLCSPNKQLSTLNYVTDSRSAFALAAHVEGPDGDEVLDARTHNVWRHHREAHEIFLWSSRLILRNRLAARGQVGLPGLRGRLAARGQVGLPGLRGRLAARGHLGLPGLRGRLAARGHLGLPGLRGLVAVIVAIVVVIGVGVGNVVLDLYKCGVGGAEGPFWIAEDANGLTGLHAPHLGQQRCKGRLLEPCLGLTRLALDGIEALTGELQDLLSN